jgi:hypothetical protein
MFTKVITSSKLRTYIKADANFDSYSRYAVRLKEKERLSDEDWAFLDDLSLRLTIKNHGKESASYAKETTTLILRNLETDQVTSDLEKYVSGEKYKSIYNTRDKFW